MLIFRQLFDAASSTYTYLLGHDGQAVLIDPVYEHERRDSALLRELGLQLVATLDTHVHADHVTGAWLLKQRWGSQILLSAQSQATQADRLLQHGDRVAFGGRWLEVRATPGHTSGCLSYVLDDHSLACTGDCLLIRGCGRTDFQQGSATQLFQSVHQQIYTLPEHCLLYPGHDYRGLTVSSVGEERQHNPRLGGKADLGDFAGYMNNLGLPHPKLMDVAVPANLRCGRPQDDAQPPADPGWAPLTWTFGGVWEMQPADLEERLGSGSDGRGAIQVVDVREAAEFCDVLGHVPGARSLPLSQLLSRWQELDPQRPVVTVCRSGTRSAQAAVLLQKSGLQQVANLAGGMLRWRAASCRVEGAAA